MKTSRRRFHPNDTSFGLKALSENSRHISETLSEWKAFIPEAQVATLALVAFQ